MPYWCAAASVLTVLTLFAILRTAKMRRRSRFQVRNVLSDDEWYDHYYGQSEFSKSVVMSILSAFAAELSGSVSRTQLRPDDRLEEYALTLWGVPTEDSLEIAICELETKFGDNITPESTWETLDDVIVGICRQLSTLDGCPTKLGGSVG